MVRFSELYKPHPSLPGREGFLKYFEVSPTGGDLKGAGYAGKRKIKD